MNTNIHQEAGYTLLEVLIALLVFSVGLLGLAAMLVSAVKGNHQAYHHSQAVYVAEAMADGLRANLSAVNGGDYNTGGSPGAPALIGTHSGGSCDSACNAQQLANRDLGNWVRMANGRLPNGRIGINCNRVGAIPMPATSGFNGICTIRVAWNETGDVGQSAASSENFFTWMVQP